MISESGSIFYSGMIFLSDLALRSNPRYRIPGPVLQPGPTHFRNCLPAARYGLRLLARPSIVELKRTIGFNRIHWRVI